MMKTIEETKQGLHCCSVDPFHCGYGCPYMKECHEEERLKQLEKDALAHIMILQKKELQDKETIFELYQRIHQLEEEKDRLSSMLAMHMGNW